MFVTLICISLIYVDHGKKSCMDYLLYDQRSIRSLRSSIVHFTRTVYSYIKMVQCPCTQIFFLINFFVDPRGRSPKLYLEVYIFHNDPAMNQDP